MQYTNFNIRGDRTDHQQSEIMKNLGRPVIRCVNLNLDRAGAGHGHNDVMKKLVSTVIQDESCNVILVGKDDGGSQRDGE